MTTIMYGIPNCDTIKKAKKQLEAQGVNFEFHDYRKDGVSDTLIKEFLTSLTWEDLLNKRGTTYRQLSDEQKNNLNEQTAIELLVEYPAMIKRPVLVHNGKYLIGFNQKQYEELN
ncbi:ArsC family reductase [Pseudoalteromonas xiamenensis]|uniref:ArsC family reductase n=1 Tax=Pseudoalteromonas xiamenensis TaxID=882626 RepID=A0A975DIG8_9GAMM|nr:ArsC family reductase [Pseudoalteromonas xiamenensis]QTH71765.1 ArsC family reductase [Pseudoalteromonas xiamenensis]